MKKLTLALVVSLATLTLSQAEIGETMKEVMSHNSFAFHSGKPIQFHDCPALQFALFPRGTLTLYSTHQTDYHQKTSLGIHMVNGKLFKITPSWPRGISSMPG
jgi:hypothetical protein